MRSAADLAAQVASLERRLATLERTSRGEFSSFQDDDGNEIDLADLAADVTAAADNGDQAMTDAATAHDVALSAQATADGKGTVYYQASAPATGTEFDVWFDTDADFLPHSWDGSAWVASPFGTLAVGNLDAGRITTGILNAILVRTSSGVNRAELDVSDHALVFYLGGAEAGRVGAQIGGTPFAFLESGGVSAKVIGSGDVGFYVDGGRIQANDGLSFLGQSQDINGLTYGSTSDTTDSSGTITIAHGLGGTPSTVVANILGASSPRYLTVSNKTTTHFDVTVWNGTTADSAGVSRTIQWIAIT